MVVSCLANQEEDGQIKLMVGVLVKVKIHQAYLAVDWLKEWVLSSVNNY